MLCPINAFLGLKNLKRPYPIKKHLFIAKLQLTVPSIMHIPYVIHAINELKIHISSVCFQGLHKKILSVVPVRGNPTGILKFRFVLLKVGTIQDKKEVLSDLKSRKYCVGHYDQFR